MPLPFIWLFAFYVPFTCAFGVLAPAHCESLVSGDDLPPHVGGESIHAYGDDLLP